MEYNYDKLNDIEWKIKDINEIKCNKCEFIIKKNEIINEILRFKCNKALGFNDIPAIYVKNFKYIFGELYYYFINYIIFLGYIPAKLNVKYLYPVYKMNGKECTVDGYRDVYNSRYILKLMDKIITNEVYKKLYQKKYVFKNYAYLKGMTQELCNSYHIENMFKYI